jgi:hypothetical protein
MEESNFIEERNLKGGLASPNVKGGYGVKDYYKFYKQGGGMLSIKDYRRIMRNANAAVVDEVQMFAEDYTLPAGIGRIVFRKRKNKIYMVDGKPKSTAQIDWKSTGELWMTNTAARAAKILKRYTGLTTGRYTFRIAMHARRFKNSEYFAFIYKRSFKRKFATRINSYHLPKIEVEIAKTI